MTTGLLPVRQMWVGINAYGDIIAASIESKKPGARSKVFHGCAGVFKCKIPDNVNVFDANFNDLEKME